MSNEKKPTLTQQIADLKEIVAAQEALMEGLIRDNNRLLTFAEKAAPFLNELRQGRQNTPNKPPFVPTKTQQPQNRQAAPQQRTPAIKTLPKRQPQQNTSNSASTPSGAMYEQYKLAVKTKAIETGKSITLVPFGKASTMTLEQLMATLN